MPKPRANRIPVRSPASRPIRQSPHELAQLFRLLGDESRLRILQALGEERELDVSALREILRMKQPAVSHHLTLLRMAGVVDYRRRGKHNYYHIASNLVAGVLEHLRLEHAVNGPLPSEHEMVLTPLRR
jgi:DNA-binding transcriptional ArsR family regulator